MNAYLYKLRFETAAHFGSPDSAMSLESSEEHFCADTLFSALCHTAAAMYGPEAASRLCAEVDAGEFLLSDSMPWKENTFFLPRPMLDSDARADINPQTRKALKKLAWLPVGALDDFAAFSQGAGDFTLSGIPKDFGDFAVTEHASISRESGGDANPYAVSLFQFYGNCGLYFLALLKTPEQEARLSALIRGLGVTGIGGKTGAGYGKFSLLETINLRRASDAQSAWLRGALSRSESPRQLLLTTSLPRPEELASALDGARFQMVRRAGFTRPASPEARDTKKRVQYFLTSGSVLRRRFAGGLYPVGADDEDLVFRYGRPVFLGLSE
ncbi:MAG: type III-A CRISPR-associated RAMP protein Csm4 [Oscillibacter sp.]|nr:type III-A CRISPR-associated RAMP protein Csm4 [Oscillibacter sp.]